MVPQQLEIDEDWIKQIQEVYDQCVQEQGENSTESQELYKLIECMWANLGEMFEIDGEDNFIFVKKWEDEEQKEYYLNS